MLDIVELADRRTRFALLILGALNAVNLLIVVRADALGVQGLNLTFIRAYITSYVLLSLYFFSYAIVALKPRLRMRRSRNPEVGGLRLVDDILDQTFDAYYERWQQTQVGQLSREMAFHAHILARTNAEKYHALERVYVGLVILVALTAVLIGVVGFHAIGTR